MLTKNKYVRIISKCKEEFSRFFSLHDLYHVFINKVAFLMKDKVLDNDISF